MDDPLTEGAKGAQAAGRAVQAVAETTGKALDTARGFGGFVERTFPATWRQLDRLGAQRLWFREYRGWARFLKEVQREADARGLAAPTRDIPLKLLLPLAEAGAIEDDDMLREIWARMWVNAADANHRAEVRRTYVSILSDCTRLDVHILAALYNVEPELRGQIVRGELLPDKTVSVSPGEDRLAAFAEKRGSLSDEKKRSLGNLRRLGLINGDTWGASGDRELINVQITALGVGLVEACTLGSRNAPS